MSDNEVTTVGLPFDLDNGITQVTQIKTRTKVVPVHLAFLLFVKLYIKLVLVI